MSEPIELTDLINRATKFYLGRFDEVITLQGAPPVWLERQRGAWVIRAEHTDSMNPHYFNEMAPHWRYKRGTSFKTFYEAAECFNQWLLTTRPEEANDGE